MALLTAGNVTFVHAKNGALWTGVKTGQKDSNGKDIYENKKAYGLEGRIDSITRVEDEYEGRKIGKIQVRVVDADGGVFSLKWTEESWFTQGFFARIGNVYLGEPVIIGARASDTNEKVTFCWMKQYGKVVQKNDDFPKPTKEVKRGKESYNYDDMLEQVDSILNDLKEKLNQPTGQAATSVRQNENVGEVETEETPF